jgi:hypothetical protein
MAFKVTTAFAKDALYNLRHREQACADCTAALQKRGPSGRGGQNFRYAVLSITTIQA